MRLTQRLARIPRRLRRLHADQRGTISIISVFAILLLAMLLGMLMNVGRQVDNKVKMQNAADAASYSGGVVLARGMNDLAFTNHLLCDVFALTAFLREARDQHSKPIVPEILAAWNSTGPVFARSNFTKFKQLGPAIQQKVPMEQEMFSAYSTWGAATSDAVLPLLEEILAKELIPEYQRAVTAATPGLAQLAANEIAMRHGLTSDGLLSPDRGPLQGMLWRSLVAPVGGAAEGTRRTLPVVDPELDNVPDQEAYRDLARQQRQALATTYLAQWNSQAMVAFQAIGRMSQFAALWNGFTCGQLQQLLAENQDRNLLFEIRQPGDAVANLPGPERNAFLATDYMFMGLVYWRQLTPYAPGLFASPVVGDNVTYAQVLMFIPRNRLIRVLEQGGGGGGGAPSGIPIGGVPGQFVDLPPVAAPPDGVGDPGPPAGGGDSQPEWIVEREQRPTSWDLLNQSWRVQLVPATHPSLLTILQTPPTFDGAKQQAQAVTLPNLGNLSPEDLSVISNH